ncbi:hypothetical protein [Streptomyces bauhiniae]|uniref:DNA polymerase Y family protein n=1 Tax=Streptomyces bauhiniae TaxID=2340725 RepID=UPI003665357C
MLLQLRVIALHGVHTTIGGGRSPMLATVALAPTPQGNVTVIDPDDTAVTAFLRPRPLTALPGIGTATARTLGRFGILTIGQLADTPTAALTRILGAHAACQLHARAHGTDDRPVQRTALVRSTSASHAFARDELSPEAHLGALTALTDQLGARLRTAGDTCRGLTLIVRLTDRSTLTRSRTVPEPTGPSSGHPVHLRLRGADSGGTSGDRRTSGSPPPARSGPRRSGRRRAPDRFTSARAEGNRSPPAWCGRSSAAHRASGVKPPVRSQPNLRRVCSPLLQVGHPWRLSVPQGPRDDLRAHGHAPQSRTSTGGRGGLRARAGMASSIPPVFRRPDGHGGVEG